MGGKEPHQAPHLPSWPLPQDSSPLELKALPVTSTGHFKVPWTELQPFVFPVQEDSLPTPTFCGEGKDPGLPLLGRAQLSR